MFLCQKLCCVRALVVSIVVYNIEVFEPNDLGSFRRLTRRWFGNYIWFWIVWIAAKVLSVIDVAAIAAVAVKLVPSKAPPCPVLAVQNQAIETLPWRAVVGMPTHLHRVDSTILGGRFTVFLLDAYAFLFYVWQDIVEIKIQIQRSVFGRLMRWSFGTGSSERGFQFRKRLLHRPKSQRLSTIQ